MLDDELPTRRPADVRKRVPRAVTESATTADGMQNVCPGSSPPSVVKRMRSRRRLHSATHALRVRLVEDGRPNARMAEASVADRRGWKAPTLATAPFEVRIVNVDCAAAGVTLSTKVAAATLSAPRRSAHDRSTRIRKALRS